MRIVTTIFIFCLFFNTSSYAYDQVVDVGLAEDDKKTVDGEIAALEEVIEKLKNMIKEDAETLSELSDQEMEVVGEEEISLLREKFQKINNRWWEAKRYVSGLEEHVKVLNDVVKGKYYTSVYRMVEKDKPAESVETLLKNAKQARELASDFMTSHKETE